MREQQDKQGFTLVEIVIVAAVIGLLAALAAPLFSQARTSSVAHTCKNNLRQMEYAKQLAATELHWKETDGPGSIGNPFYRDTCSSYLKGATRPECPTGAACFYNGINQPATCQSGIASHVLR